LARLLRGFCATTACAQSNTVRETDGGFDVVLNLKLGYLTSVFEFKLKGQLQRSAERTVFYRFVTASMNQHYLLFLIGIQVSCVERSVWCPTSWAGPAANTAEA
jgi:hypothetical protein